MEQYIPISVVLAELQRRRKKIPKNETDKRLRAVYGNEAFVLTDLLSYFEDLEVKEVDLDKEFERFLNEVEGVPRMWHSDEQIEWAKGFAKHFFELGLRAQKELGVRVQKETNTVNGRLKRKVQMLLMEIVTKSREMNEWIELLRGVPTSREDTWNLKWLARRIVNLAEKEDNYSIMDLPEDELEAIVKELCETITIDNLITWSSKHYDSEEDLAAIEAQRKL